MLQLLNSGIIRESVSDWCSPLVIVKKKHTNEVRICIDYRKINAITKRDMFPFPNIMEILDSLHGGKYYSTMDMRHGYYQVRLDPDSCCKTAFRFNGKLYEFVCMPFGLVNAPSTFSRLSKIITDRCINTQAILDDLITYSGDLVTHIKHVCMVLDVIEECGITLHPNKCVFAQEQVQFLGYTLQGDELLPQYEKVKAVCEYPAPSNVKSIKTFLGMCGYYRALIPHFASIAAPLYSLLKKDAKFIWSENCHTVKSLKKALVSNPVRRRPDFNRQFIVVTDASVVGFGCVLEQVDDSSKSYVIEYGSKMFNKCQLNYPVIEKEAYAIIWALHHWEHYLLYKHFILKTDHRPLVWLKSLKNTAGKLGRWSLYLSTFNFEIYYIPGKENAVSDALSRNFVDETNCSAVYCSLINNSNTVSLLSVSREDWYAEQLNDNDLSSIFVHLSKFPKDRQTAAIAQSNVDKYFIERDLLYHQNGDVSRIVVPTKFRSSIMFMFHNAPTGGHLAFQKVWDKLKERYYWPNVYKDLKYYCKSCEICAKCKRTTPKTVAPLIPIDVSTVSPFQVIGFDILGPFIPPSSSCKRYILLSMCYFTKWPEAVATINCETSTVCSFLNDVVFCRHGIPDQLISDQGTQLENSTFKQFCGSHGIKHCPTTVYHPQSDGLVERMNRTLLSMLCTMATDRSFDWDENLDNLLFAYRTAKHDSTRFSPFETLYNRQPKLSIDVIHNNLYFLMISLC